MRLPRIMLTAAASGSGKTLCTCGLLQALVNRKLKTVSYKCGPDYIDPMFHTRVIGTKSRNLDTFFTDRETTRYLMEKNGAGADIAVVEGVMGYYDGLAGISSDGSAYDVARTTDTPALLLVSCKGMSVSIVPFIKGFLEYKREQPLKGVILNRISPMLYPRVKQMIEEELPIKVYGYIPEMKDCLLESRHLGLVLPDEVADLKESLQQLAEKMEETLDIDGILQLAASAPELSAKAPDLSALQGAGEGLRIGVAMDEAFCFFYEDNLDLLRESGAILVPFSPIHDQRVPEKLDGLIFNGGYPELYAKALSENESMKESIRALVKKGIPVTAECGGFMYLHGMMEDMDGKPYRMAGVIDGYVRKTPRLTRFGYITLTGGCVFGEDIGPIPAHEFHYFDSDACGSDWHAGKPLSKRGWECIHADKNLFAGFPHIYYYANPSFAAAYLCACRKEKNSRLNDLG